MTERSLGYKLLGITIFAGVPAVVVGLVGCLFHPVAGAVLFVMMLACMIDLLKPNPERGEKW